MLIGTVTALSALVGTALCVSSCAVHGLGYLWVLPVGFAAAFLALALVVFLVLWVSCALVDLQKPQEKESKYYRFLVRMMMPAAMSILQVRMTTKGLEKAPKQGRFLLVCNHLHLVDPLVLLRYFPKNQLTFISKQENSSMFLVGKLMHKIMCQLVNRENDREALKTILKCVELINEDRHCVGVFPEGYIHGDNLMHPFRHGVFKIAQKTGVPIVVCTMRGTQDAFRNAMRLKPTDVELRVVDVIQPEQYAGMRATQIGNMAYEMMAADLGPDRVWQPDN